MKSTIRFTRERFFKSGKGFSILSRIFPASIVPENSYSEIISVNIDASMSSVFAKATISSRFASFSKSLYAASISSALSKPTTTRSKNACRISTFRSNCGLSVLPSSSLMCFNIVILLFGIVEMDVANQVHDVRHIDPVTLHQFDAEVNVVQDGNNLAVCFLP